MKHPWWYYSTMGMFIIIIVVCFSVMALMFIWVLKFWLLLLLPLLGLGYVVGRLTEGSI